MNQFTDKNWGQTICSLIAISVLAWLISPLTSAYADVKAEDQRVLSETNVTKLHQLAKEWEEEYEANKTHALTVALEKGWVIRKAFANGKTVELRRLDEFGKPIYYQTLNMNAASTISTDKLWPGGNSGLNLTGSGMFVGVWEGGGVRATHQEFSGRVIQKDTPNYPNDYHATHVAGTLIASGIDPSAKGMAFQAALHAYDWSNDESEMATAASDDLLLVSNHSYGAVAGWYTNGSDWYWYGEPTIGEDEDYKFGFYDDFTRYWDEIAHNAPYYLIVKSAGNDRMDECPDPTAGHYVFKSTAWRWTWSTYNRVNKDGGAAGYDTILPRGNAKNILTVGAVNDIIDGYGSPSDVNVTNFSGWGPTDDGRIKPDICGNGDLLKSAYGGSDTDYESMSGTSMSAPNITGSLVLLQQHFHNLNTASMRSATLKALVIHTAAEAGPDNGPDYMHGWGLMNTTQAADIITQEGNTTQMREETLNNGDTYTIDVIASGASPLVATIAWTDPPGAPPGASLDPPDAMLVNDLDLRITKDSTTYLPWILNPASPSAAAATGDNYRDNVEKIEIVAPAAGNYTIKVTHKGTLQNTSQAFSLIISGVTHKDTDVGLKGDLNADNVINLTDAILALQVITGSDPVQLRTDYTVSGADVNGDNRVGTEELIYILQEEAELR